MSPITEWYSVELASSRLIVRGILVAESREYLGRGQLVLDEVLRSIEGNEHCRLAEYLE